jgi:hypothetical protein
VMRVTLGSRRGELGSKVVTTRLLVPASTPRGSEGVVDVGGTGSSGGDDEELGDEGSGDSGATSFPQLLRSLQNAPRNDALASSLMLFSDEDEGGSGSVQATTPVGFVVTGDAQFSIRIR